MNRIVLHLFCLSLGALTAFSTLAQGATSGSRTFPTGRTCTPSESWNFSDHFPAEYQKEYRSFLGNGKKSLRGFSEAIAFRKYAKLKEEKAFAEFWMAHALLESGQSHIAYQGFLAIATKDPEPEFLGVHAAALDCLLQIHYNHPSFVVPSQASLNLTTYLDAEGAPENMRAYLKEIAWDAQTSQIQTLLGNDSVTPAQLQAALINLRGSGAYLNLAQGLVYAKKGEHFKTIDSLNAFIADAHLPSHLVRYKDISHVLLSRAHYAVGQFDLSTAELKKVSKASNELANSLSEMSWAYLQNEKYPEAIGTAMNLEAGGLRHTFEPEAPMVMAMAMNELCQYPESVKAIKTFRKNYEPIYRWLSNWVSGTADGSKLYASAIKFVKKKTDVPERVGSEWIRSPLFISTQDEVNLLFDERDASSRISKLAHQEQHAMALDILRRAKELKTQFKLAKMKLKPGQKLASNLTSSLADLRESVVHWRRMQLAAPVWSVVSKRFLASVPTQQGKLIARVNADLKTKNLRMLTQLEEIAENIQLIEVEIYNGASEDIIWQNAHPDYKEVVKGFKNEMGNSPDKVWDWGRSLASADENTEIWEDELGSFKANLFDNCSDKDRYLALHIKRRPS